MIDNEDLNQHHNYLATVETNDAVQVLLRLDSEWRTVGNRPDGPFVDVSGPGPEGAPGFPVLLADMLETHTQKSRSYTSGHPDPLINYIRAGEAVGLTGWQATFMRLSEKQQRLIGLFAGVDEAVDGEAVDETLVDIAVLSLLTVLLHRRGR